MRESSLNLMQRVFRGLDMIYFTDEIPVEFNVFTEVESYEED